MTRLLRRIAHYAIYVLAALLIALAGVALALRVWLLPDIDRYRPYLEHTLTRTIGQPVGIGVIRADWRGLSPQLHLENLRLGAPGQDAPLELPRLDAIVSWSSLLLGEVRLSELELSRPRMEIRREASGVIRVAGVAVNTGGEGGAFPDWLLAQRLIVVRDGQLSWHDEMLGAPPLELRQVKLVLHNRFGRHRLGLTARPPGSAGRKLDVRADIKGDSVGRLEDFRGQLYLYLEQASTEALRTWAPWAQESVRQGHGSLRMWLDFANRQVNGVIGDVRLNGVRLNLTADMPDMEFSHLLGRLGWRKSATGHDFQLERLAFASPSGVASEPASARVHLEPDAHGKPRLVTVTASDLQLETLTALSGAVPLPREAHDLIGQLKPRGYVSKLRVNWQKSAPGGGPDKITAQASFQDVGLEPTAKLPGVSGLTGDARVDARGGQLNLRARRLGLRYDPVFRNPLEFDELEADVSWQQSAQDGQLIRVDALRLANADLEGSGQMAITLRPNQSPLLDVRAQIPRGDGSRVWHYLPRQVSDATVDWVKSAILSGTGEQTSLVLRGPADRFPYDQGGGEFRVEVGVRDVELEYAPGWPRFQRINGRLVFHDKALDIIADSAQLANGIRLSAVQGQIPDIEHPRETSLIIRGQADGPASAFLDFIAASPVNDHLERFTESMRAQGNARLNLSLTLPLHHLPDTQVKGSLRLLDAHLDAGNALPMLENLNGDLLFTQRNLWARNLATRMLGQPANLDLETLPGGGLRAVLRGRMPAQGLSGWLPAGVLRHLQGSAGYRAELDVKQKQTELRVASNLDGLEIKLPAPLGKQADAQVPMLLLKTRDPDGRDVIHARYGQVLTARAMPGSDTEKARVGISIGRGEATMPKLPGLTLQAVLKRFDPAEWQALLTKTAADGEARQAINVPINEVELTANELVLADRVIHDSKINAQPRAEGWLLQLASREVQGEISVFDLDAGNPRVNAKFRRLEIPAAESVTARPAPAGPRRQLFSGHIEADSFIYGDKELGSLKLNLEGAVLGWRVRHLGIQNPDGQLNGTGILANHARRPSEFNLQADSPNLSALLARLGHPGYLKRGKARAEGSLNWMGGLDDFRLSDLSGKLNLEVREGQFMKADPGVGRLLGIVSLQSLPRRISLDFRDVFSEGFAFDEITGGLHMDRGVAYLTGVKMNGPAAQVELKGPIDLVRETQNLRVKVQPRLEETLAAGAILINPAIGVGALVASKILRDPISKAITFEYLVTGGWDDPQVAKIKRQPAGNPPQP